MDFPERDLMLTENDIRDYIGKAILKIKSVHFAYACINHILVLPCMQIHLLTAQDEFDEVAFKRSFSDLMSFAKTYAIVEKNALQ